MTASVTTTDEIAAEERKKQVHQQIITCIQKADTTAFRHLLDIIETFSILNKYDEKNEYTPIHVACWTNNIEILELLLTAGADPNKLYQPKSTKWTTMHIAASKQNIAMMKLLIDNGFDLVKYCNNIYYTGLHLSVFLQLCATGNVSCLDYFITSCCKNKNANGNTKDKTQEYTIDIWQRDINGYNGLHTAVNERKVSMVEYLLSKVYNTNEKRMKIFNQCVEIDGRHVSQIAACKPTENGLAVFKLLMKYGCPIQKEKPALIRYAASFSPLILDFMLNEKLYPDFIYLTKCVVEWTIRNAVTIVVHENLEIIAKYASSMKDKVSNDDYRLGIVNIFYAIVVNGTYDGYFEFFKRLIIIYLNHKSENKNVYVYDWKKFVESKSINKSVFQQILEKIDDASKEQDMVDEKWRVLLKTMCDAFDNAALLEQFDDVNKGEEKIDKMDGNVKYNEYFCTKQHLMTETSIDANHRVILNIKDCIKCRELCSVFDFVCTKCDEYICHDCVMVKNLDIMLKRRQFTQFNKQMQLYDARSKLCMKSQHLLYWIWNCRIILPFYKSQSRHDAALLSLKFLFNHKSNINTVFTTQFVKNETLFNMIQGNTNQQSLASTIQMLIKYKFDFCKLFNVYDNVTHQNGLISLCKYQDSYESIKLLIQHCQTLPNCKIDITHCDAKGNNALFYASQNSINTFSYLLSNVFFCDNYNNFKDGKIALNQQNISGQTIAHNVANNPRPHLIDTFKLLKKYNFNFNIRNYYGELPIHTAAGNCLALLSWIIDEEMFDINIKTKNAKNSSKNNKTPLQCSVGYNRRECVDLLCKIPKVKITKNEITTAIAKDNVSTLKLLIVGLFTQAKISNWNDIEMQSKDSLISLHFIKRMILLCKKNNRVECHEFFKDLYSTGYAYQNYERIVFMLDYNIKTVINDENDSKENIIVSPRHVHNYFDVKDKLGKGSFGAVNLAVNKETGDKVAIKYIDLKEKRTPTQFITSEIEALKKMSIHPNIIKLINYQINLQQHQVLLYFELATKGELYLLLKQCDHFSLRISFKYFLQLLSAINQCHKMNIVHRDLKLQNILLSNTFQLKIADFGLSSILNHDDNDNINGKNETVYNVGTRFYRSPELLEHLQLNLTVMKACDVFSLSIIFWQMMNGVKYLPFELFDGASINEANYKYIKYHNYDKFWHIHRTCHMIINCSNKKDNDKELLCDLFEQMFDYDTCQRISIEKILKHKWIVEKSSDLLFKMNNSQLEAYVRDIYNQTQHSPVRKHTLQRVRSTASTSSVDSSPVPANVANNSDSNSGNMYAIDSSRAESSYVLSDKKLDVAKPVVVMVGIEEYKNMDNKPGIVNDYINVKTMLHDIKKYDVIYQNGQNQIVHHKLDDGKMHRQRSWFDDGFDSNYDNVMVNDTTNAMHMQNITHNMSEIKENEAATVCDDSIVDLEKEFQTRWTVEELKKFNDKVFNIIESRDTRHWNYKYKYDCLIYIVSGHIKHDIQTFEHLLCDSNGEFYSFDKIFDRFNNANCPNIRKMPKIFILDGFDPNLKEGGKQEHKKRIDHGLKIAKIINNDETSKIDFVNHYKRVLYSNCKQVSIESINNDGNVLINSFCASLANNETKELHLDTLVQQTQSRMNNIYVYDENYIESRCVVTFVDVNHT